MEKKIEDYLHLYFGCDCRMIKSDGSMTTDILKIEESLYMAAVSKEWFKVNIKPILRPLSDMTEEEKRIQNNIYYAIVETEDSDIEYTIRASADVTRYLLSCGFDLFGLIDAGLAIDKTKIST